MISHVNKAYYLTSITLFLVYVNQIPVVVFFSCLLSQDNNSFYLRYYSAYLPTSRRKLNMADTKTFDFCIVFLAF